MERTSNATMPAHISASVYELGLHHAFEARSYDVSERYSFCHSIGN